MIDFDDKKQEKDLSEYKIHEREDLAKILSRKYGISYVDLTRMPINTAGLRLVSEEQSRDALVGVFDLISKKVKMAVVAPKNPKTNAVVDELKAKGYIPTLYMASQESVEKVWDRYKDLSLSMVSATGAFDVSSGEITEIMKKISSLDDFKKITKEIMVNDVKVSRLLEIIVAGAMALRASDIHVEPEEKSVRVRYRLDGVLVDVLYINESTYHLLLSRIKLLSGMKLNLGGAQDGRFSINLKDKEIEIRASVLPSAYSESIVLRVLNPDSISVSLESLGIPPRLLTMIEKEINKPEGMLLTTGPTGSGKTTSLYAFLKKVYTPEVKIITVENPIEYHVDGLVQTQINKATGYTFIAGLRAILRQDPDIIMIGEIRDTETAEIAINSALTGHLVFSTLHTNSAAGTFPRLIDLGINPKTIVSALSVAMAQRLVRKLCEHCKKEVPIEGREKKIIDDVLATVKNITQYIETIPTIMAIPQGCAECNFTGYKGRIGLYEAIFRDEKIEKILVTNPSEREIWRAAEDQNILTMRQDGVIRILKKVTSFSELERVIDVEGGY